MAPMSAVGETPGPAPAGRASVGDVVLRRPKVLDVTARVDDARTLLDDDHVHLVVVVDGDRLVGTATRADVLGARGEAPVLSVVSTEDRTVESSADAEQVRELMGAAGVRRLAVVEDGAFVGLLCLKRTGHGFCSDGDVAARAEPSSGTRPCPEAEAGSGHADVARPVGGGPPSCRCCW